MWFESNAYSLEGLWFVYFVLFSVVRVGALFLL